MEVQLGGPTDSDSASKPFLLVPSCSDLSPLFLGGTPPTTIDTLPLKNTTFLNFLGNMGYMFVKDENLPRAKGVLRGKTQKRLVPAYAKLSNLEGLGLDAIQAAEVRLLLGASHGWPCSVVQIWA